VQLKNWPADSPTANGQRLATRHCAGTVGVQLRAAGFGTVLTSAYCSVAAIKRKLELFYWNWGDTVHCFCLVHSGTNRKKKNFCGFHRRLFRWRSWLYNSFMPATDCFFVCAAFELVVVATAAAPVGRGRGGKTATLHMLFFRPICVASLELLVS
jgi:hypothetical protein